MYYRLSRINWLHICFVLIISAQIIDKVVMLQQKIPFIKLWIVELFVFEVEQL